MSSRYFDSPLYQNWRANRFKAIIQHYDKDFFRNKSLLEVGASNGHFGEMFAQLGANVTSYEGRKQNFDELVAAYPRRRTRLVDLDKESISETFDIVLNVGLVYHLVNFEKHLFDCMSHCTELILETEIIDLDREGYWVEREEVANQGAGLYGFGTRATTSYIERLLGEGGFRWTRPANPGIMNTPPWFYDWVPQNKGVVGFRAMWFCTKTPEKKDLK